MLLYFALALTLLFVMLFQCMSVTFAATSSKIFNYSPQLNDNMCVDWELVFTHNDCSKIHCSVICHIKKSCVGVFYDETQQQCFGCRKIGPTYLRSIQGTVALLLNCSFYLVKYVDDSQLFASSMYKNYTRHSAIYARLDTIETHNISGAWSPWKSEDPNAYIQVDFLAVKRVEGVVTQGRSGGYQWVTAYLVALSLDCINWNYVVDTEGDIVRFSGNNDKNTYVTNLFDSQKFARCVRVRPISYFKYPSMRFDIVGCDM